MSMDYQWLLNSPSGEKWKRIGVQKCSGVVVPLFSIYSQTSIGIGEYGDLKKMVDWCRKSGMKIIQLLPLNDVGFSFTPYDSQSMFALDPMYLSLNHLQGVDVSTFKKEMTKLKSEFSGQHQRVNYGIKSAKLTLLWDIYQSLGSVNSPAFEAFKTKTAFWLSDYATYKILKDVFEQKSWLAWDEAYRHKLTPQVNALGLEKQSEIDFHKWLQWQCYEQMKDVKNYANSQQIFLMGDIPFLVSKDSADVWANQDYFKLGFAAGAPPDLYFAAGQRWGMPPYHWENIAANHYDYLKEKLTYAESFYDLYRIDHFVGMFRLWSISNDAGEHETGLKGFFDPSDENQWEEHGKKLLEVMLNASTMLPCAEDLGTVPDCSYKVIKEYGLVGTDVQRWMKKWKEDCDFKKLSEYRPNGIAAISTHDLPVLQDWWENELATVDEYVFRKKCEGRGFDTDWLIGQLFYPKADSSDRLRWRENIDSVDTLLGILYRRPDEVRDFIDLFSCSRYEKEQFLALLGIENEVIEGFSVNLASKILEKTNESSSIFSIQLLADWLSISLLLKDRPAQELRINIPGRVNQTNWNLVMPFSLETMLEDSSADILFHLNKKSGRLGGNT